MNKATSVEAILSVPSVEETIEWYERVLGWQGGFDVFDPDGKCGFGGVNGSGENQAEGARYVGFDLIRHRGDAAQYANDKANFSFLIYVEDVDALYRRVVEANWPVQAEPQDQFWGARTFFLQDLNGFDLQFATKQENPIPEELNERYKSVG